MAINYEWDPGKARANFRKHGIHFADAREVFEDGRALTIEDDFAFEQRFVTIGSDVVGHVLVVVFTWRDERIRIISARKANHQETKMYEGNT